MSNMAKDLLGLQKGKWTVIQCVDRKSRKWECQCLCGTKKVYTSAGIKLFNDNSSCGCTRATYIKVGDTGITNRGHKYIVHEVNNSHNIIVKFLEPQECYVSAHAGNLRNGVLLNPFERTVCGVGFIGQGKYDSYTHNECFEKWYGMFRRTLLDAHKPRNSSYTDVQICEEWHNFQNFAEWMSSQVILDSSWHLDKDLLVKGSKIYSPETCVFLPPEVNMFFTKRKSKRGDYPIGVSYRETTSRFLAGMTWEGKNVYLGSFSSPEEAFCAYKARKEQCAKELAEKWHDKIDARAYEALLNYTVEITD